MQIDLDVRRLLCPIPVIRLGEEIAKAQVNDKIQILASDLGVLHDIPAWCKIHGHKVLACNKKTDEIILLVEKIG